MPVDVSETLRHALAKLEAEKGRIERQIMGVRQALGAGRVGLDGSAAATTTGTKRRRKRMSAAERKAVSARMKAFWAKRRGGAGKGKRKKG